MDSIKLFKEAAKALQQDGAYIDLENARKLNDADNELQSQIGDFNLARIELNGALQNETLSEEEIEKMNDKVNALYEEIMSNDSMVAYNQAKKEIDEKLQYINAIIMAAINGQDPETVQPPQPEGCSGSCSSCGGCH